VGVTKANVVVANNITMTAGAADVNSADQDLTASYRTVCNITFTNGGTGPTIAPRVDVQIAEDTTNYKKLVTVNGDTIASSVNFRQVVLEDPVEHCRFVSGSNTGQNVTLRIVTEKITAI
jgi:hypothetical protein